MDSGDGVDCEVDDGSFDSQPAFARAPDDAPSLGSTWYQARAVLKSVLFAMATEDLSPRRPYRSRHPIGLSEGITRVSGSRRRTSLKAAREKEFHALTDEEATQIEVLYNELFGDFGGKAV